MSFILPKQPEKKDINSFVLVCEGMGDANFIDRLLRHAGISNCCVGCPSDESSGGQGVDRIPQYLEAIQAITKGRNMLSGIAVIVDSDRSIRKRFRLISNGFRSANFPKPESPYSILQGQPRVGVYFIPKKGRNGTLENLLLEAAFKRRPAMERCIDDFSSCAKTKGWESNARAKMKLSALVAVSCKRNPWASSNTMWGDPGCPVPIGSVSFREIRDFLTAFSAP